MAAFHSESQAAFGRCVRRRTAGWGISALWRPGAPICAIGEVLTGSVVGGVAGGVVAESLDEELEEFSHWDIF